MITLDEIKEAVSKIADTEIIKTDGDEKKGQLRFKKNNDTFTIYPITEDSVSKTNLRLSRVIKLPNQKSLSRDEGELIEASMNLISNNPCKVVYIYNIEEVYKDGRFFITNVYTDKLDQFEKFANQEVKSSNLVVLILGMMIEVITCTQEIFKQASEAIERRLEGIVTDGK
ncbi:hypothetical protein BZ160_14220 [Pantoea vagans]|nr:hypothetical protein [Pantoea vagans]OQV40439.1 hypothetical protein BZ160_14220 [Pantoea vagans]